MKRSEMLQKMENFINEQSLMLGADMKRDCEYLLKMLEEAGMTPPAHVINTINGVHYFPDRKVYEWEKE